jgi:hypothetical protein
MRRSSATRDRHDHLKRLRENGIRRIAELNLPDPCEMATLVRRLGEMRNRPVTLVSMAMKASHPCGMWLAARTEDVIFFDANTTKAHQEHIILHELGHIICCHRGAGLLDDDSARQLFPNLNPDIIRDMLMRATYHDVQEQEAEIIAYLLSQRVGSTAERHGVSAAGDAGRPGDAADAGKTAMLSRIERTLI